MKATNKIETKQLNIMEIKDRIEQAIYEGNIHYCFHCKKKQPIELTHYDPDEDVEPDLIVCLICGNAIDFIDNL